MTKPIPVAISEAIQIASMLATTPEAQQRIAQVLEKNIHGTDVGKEAAEVLGRHKKINQLAEDTLDWNAVAFRNPEKFLAYAHSRCSDYENIDQEHNADYINLKEELENYSQNFDVSLDHNVAKDMIEDEQALKNTNAILPAWFKVITANKEAEKTLKTAEEKGVVSLKKQ